MPSFISVCTFAISTPLLVGSGAIVAAIVVIVIIIFTVVLILLKVYNRYGVPWALMLLSLQRCQNEWELTLVGASRVPRSIHESIIKCSNPLWVLF